MVAPGDLVDGADELFPATPLRRENAPALARQLVQAAASLPRLFRPAALNPAALLEPVEQRIERRGVKPDIAVRALLDQAGDVIAVPGPRLDQRQDQQLRTALLQLAAAMEE